MTVINDVSFSFGDKHVSQHFVDFFFFNFNYGIYYKLFDFWFLLLTL